MTVWAQTPVTKRPDPLFMTIDQSQMTSNALWEKLYESLSKELAPYPDYFAAADHLNILWSSLNGINRINHQDHISFSLPDQTTFLEIFPNETDQTFMVSLTPPLGLCADDQISLAYKLLAALTKT